jgi:hypothetical protein
MLVLELMSGKRSHLNSGVRAENKYKIVLIISQNTFLN